MRFEAWRDGPRQADYVRAIYDAGNRPWWERPERVAVVAARLGLPEGTPADEVRRALWSRGHRR